MARVAFARQFFSLLEVAASAQEGRGRDKQLVPKAFLHGAPESFCAELRSDLANSGSFEPIGGGSRRFHVNATLAKEGSRDEEFVRSAPGQRENFPGLGFATKLVDDVAGGAGSKSTGLQQGSAAVPR